MEPIRGLCWIFGSFILFICMMLLCTIDVQGADTVPKIVHLGWEHDFPPDIMQYEISCTPNHDNVVEVAPDSEALHITDSNTTGIKSFEWQGEAMVTRGKIECYVRAVDLAGQLSEWGGPAVWDLVPSTVIKVHFITSPDIKLEISK